MRVIVYHEFYGCESGCCGHTVELDSAVCVPRTGAVRKADFQFDHPAWLRGEDRTETPLEFAQRLVRETFGEEHVKDLDWDNCLIVDD